MLDSAGDGEEIKTKPRISEFRRLCDVERRLTYKQITEMC